MVQTEGLNGTLGWNSSMISTVKFHIMINTFDFVKLALIKSKKT